MLVPALSVTEIKAAWSQAKIVRQHQKLPVPLPVHPGVQVVLEQLDGGFSRVEVVVRDALPASVREGADVLGEGGLAREGEDGQHRGSHQTGPRQHKAAQVDCAEHRSPPVFVTPAWPGLAQETCAGQRAPVCCHADTSEL